MHSLHDAADKIPFVTVLANAFDKNAIKKSPTTVSLLTIADGSYAKPRVTLEQLAAISFKVQCPFQRHHDPSCRCWPFKMHQILLGSLLCH